MITKILNWGPFQRIQQIDGFTFIAKEIKPKYVQTWLFYSTKYKQRSLKHKKQSDTWYIYIPWIPKYDTRCPGRVWISCWLAVLAMNAHDKATVHFKCKTWSKCSRSDGNVDYIYYIELLIRRQYLPFTERCHVMEG